MQVHCKKSVDVETHGTNSSCCVSHGTIMWYQKLLSHWWTFCPNDWHHIWHRERIFWPWIEFGGLRMHNVMCYLAMSSGSVRNDLLKSRPVTTATALVCKTRMGTRYSIPWRETWNQMYINFPIFTSICSRVSSLPLSSFCLSYNCELQAWRVMSNTTHVSSKTCKTMPMLQTHPWRKALSTLSTVFLVNELWNTNNCLLMKYKQLSADEILYKQLSPVLIT